MITFETLRLKNFRSYGNNFTEISFRDGFDLLAAKNGAGKSSCIQSLTYCLFGKVPKLKISELVNNINQSDMLVETEFRKNKDSYKIIRGEKPKIFEIYKNGELIDQKSKSLDYQDMLEKEILGINLSSFQMLVSLDTSLLNRSFITMSEGDRREFLETILDIRVLYFINQILTTRLNLIKTQKTELMYKIKIRNDSLENELKKQEEIKKINDDITKNGNQILKERIEKLDELKNKLPLYEEAFRRISENESIVETLTKEIDEIQKEIKSQKNKYTKIEQELYRVNAIINAAIKCEKCDHVNTSEDIAETYVENLEIEKESLRKLLLELKDNYDSKQTSLKKSQKIVDEKTRIRNNKKNLEDEISYFEDEVEKARNFQLLPENDDEVEKLKTELGIFSIELSDVEDNECKLNTIKKLISDDGIKKKIFEKYIPIFNLFLNEFLIEFSMPYTVLFDDTFNIKILDRGEERGFYTFSASEKMRINLAIMFSFLKLIETRKGMSFNLLLIDELLDNALSTEMLDIILKFIKYKIDNKNKIIISHNTSLDLEMFDRCFTVEKQNNFSEFLQRNE